MTINVIQHDDRLRYLQPFYNGAFSIMPKHYFDDQFFLLTAVLFRTWNLGQHFFDISKKKDVNQSLVSLINK
jgi:hypothetical protein